MPTAVEPAHRVGPRVPESRPARRPVSRARARRELAPLLIGGVLACAYLLYTPKTGDLAAQSFRVEALVRNGLTPWNNYWYSGHHLPGYSVLFPVFGSIVTAPVAGTIGAFVAVIFFSRVLREHTDHPTVPTVLLALGLAANLVSGRLTFVLGIALGIAAVWAATRRWPAAAALPAAGALAAASALASPVAGAFVAVAGLAVVLVHRREPAMRRLGLALVVCPLLVIAVLTHWFPEGGFFPFPWWVLVQALAAAALCVGLLRSEAKVLRAGAALYLVVCLGGFLVPSPMGANAARLGALLAAPLLVAFGDPRGRRLLFAAALVFVVVWQWEAPIHDLALASDDPSVDQAYYQPLLDHLGGMHFATAPFRIEIPSTANHWEADYVGLQYPIARGWDRQLDRRYNDVFYDGELTADRYLAWLRHEGVSLVAVPTLAPELFDPPARDEVALVRAGIPDLVPLWHSPNWTLYRVRGSAGLATGAGRLRRLTLNSFEVQFDAPGAVVVRTHWSPNFAVTSGDACIEPAPDGWTTVIGYAAGTARVEAGFDVDALAPGTPQCMPPGRSGDRR